MKKLVVTLLAFFPLWIFAQTEGIIQFKETIALNIELPEGMEAFASQIPSSKSHDMVLTFNAEATLYESAKNDAAVEDLNMGSEEGGMMMNMKFEMPENKTFTNIAEGTMVNKQDFMGKKFLIQGDVEKYKWKLTGEQETILGYPCQKATYKDSTSNLMAWFTPQIPVAAGPHGIAGLPGMILKLDMNDGEMVTEATSVELKKLEKGAIKVPKKGKKVSKEEFEKIQYEKLKEMEVELGTSGSFKGTRIIIQN